ncbi:MAG: SusD/RagB family nutrient-binding outer membrane lipoprotein, partial [Bacteroidota bacterium]
MKVFKNKYIVLVVVALMSFSCEDYLGGDINQDPNKTAFVPLQGTLAQVQIQLSDIQGGQFSRLNCMFTQQVEGVARQWETFNQYNIGFARFDFIWEDVYENVLIEIRSMEADATENGFNHYLGVLNVLEAYTLLLATDVWGDMPYTEALQGLDVLSPVYDSQSGVIYPRAYELLDNALSLFAGSPGPVTPGSEDVYYGGDVASWTKAVYAIRARARLHDGDYAGALADVQQSFESAAEEMSFQYSSASPAAWFRFNRDRTGDLQFHPTMRGIMDGLNDSLRVAIFGTNYEQHEEQPYLIDAYKEELISYREIKFIEAETLLRTGGAAADVEAAYLEAITASFEEVGLTAADAEAYAAQAIVNPGAGSIELEHIMTQKYI